ncbi:hypothetical protein MUY21_12840, partial [Aliiroseovarius sp. S2029]|uniref:hypothetical protein n=1 Tax=Aliiroseovarius sp. S2029 TaxID=2936988 RepID=UPI0020BF6C69
LPGQSGGVQRLSPVRACCINTRPDRTDLTDKTGRDARQNGVLSVLSVSSGGAWETNTIA